ncbi:asparagine synthase-related protein [Nocardiopsis mangrovi]|uniref:asparagine synthase (glutamine-hydrolyzing) n=1 Tax=Nocardiopsis mangrovi TaxID=1179818 RepID=A0ABV9DY10_9ACTN
MVTPSLGGAWWLMLPGAAPEPPPDWPVIARHSSGRAWLVGEPGPVLTAKVGEVKAAAIGDVLAEPGEFADALHRAVAHRDYDALTGFAGSYQLLVSEPGRMLAYSDAAGLRRVYTARYGRAVVAGDRARVLAAVRGAGPDPEWTAGRMCAPAVPGPVRETRSPYEGVTPVPAGCRAELAGEQPAGITRYWHPPSAEAPLRDGAVRLREALENAIAGRVRHVGGPVTVELSGGLDSAALAALAVRAVGAEQVRLVTTPSRTSGDLPWARLIAEHLGACHEVLDDSPELFADLPNAVPSHTDEPPAAVGAARLAHTVSALARAGSRVHLNGQGGDEVLGAPLSHLGLLLRQRHHGAVRLLRGHAALHATSAVELARHALSSQPHWQWLREAAECLDGDVDPIRDAVAWEAYPRMAPWASPHARRLVTDALAVSEVEPWGERTVHAALARVRTSAAAAATYGQAMTALGGPPVVFPFFDRPVVEACLTVRPEARSDPWVFKPLLAEAMRDVLPEALLARTTKGSYTPDIHRGWARHRARVLDLVRSPALAELGLVEPDRLHRALVGWGAAGLPPAYVTDLLTLELWTRTTDVVRQEAL